MWNPFKKTPAPLKSYDSDELLVVTPDSFAWIVGKLLYERKSPFCREDWQPASIVIPEEWDGLFEMAAWANQYAVLIKLIANGRSGGDASKVLHAVDKHFVKMEWQWVSSLMAKMAVAEPLPDDHPVFSLPECSSLEATPFQHAFGRAGAALEQIEAMPEAQRLEALSKLGRCLILATHNATIRFGPLTEKLRLLEAVDEAAE